MRAPVLAVLAAAAVVAGGCSRTGGEGAPDVGAAEQFQAYPLYWVGERFEGWDLEHVELRESGFSTLVYGTCEVDDPDGPLGPEGGTCSPPLQIQVQPLCAHLEVVARAPIWRRREVRGAPVGTIDNAPVLFSERAQVKVYRGEGADRGAAMRALQALRSANDVEPVVGPGDPIPPAPRAVLAGDAPCGDRGSA